tara:strand:+ start:1714 stop:2007 length:294 start_codon:yes stop_codon:yes gene_type:complete
MEYNLVKEIKNDGVMHQNLYKVGSNYVVASKVFTSGKEWELLIFNSNADGEVENYLEVYGWSGDKHMDDAMEEFSQLPDVKERCKNTDDRYNKLWSY